MASAQDQMEQLTSTNKESMIMGIRLNGGLEVIEFWQLERDAGNDHLREFKFDEWAVTLQPLTAQMRERCDLTDDEVAVRAQERTKEVVIGVRVGKYEDQYEPGDFTRLVVVEVIDQLTSGPDDLDGESDE